MKIIRPWTLARDVGLVLLNALGLPLRFPPTARVLLVDIITLPNAGWSKCHLVFPIML